MVLDIKLKTTLILVVRPMKRKSNKNSGMEFFFFLPFTGVWLLVLQVGGMTLKISATGIIGLNPLKSSVG